MIELTEKGRSLQQCKLLLATPFYKREAYTNYIASLLPCIKALETLGVQYRWIQIAGDAYVDRAKNSILAHFLSHDDQYTDLIMIDSDLGWDLDGFLRLLISEEEFTCGLYPMKHDSTYAVQNFVEPPCIEPSGLIEVIWATGGFVHFKRACIEKMYQVYGADYYEDLRSAHHERTVNLYCCAVYEGKRYGEDVEFCRKWRTMGGKIYVEPRINFEHVGSNVTTGNYSVAVDKQKAAALDRTIERLEKAMEVNK